MGSKEDQGSGRTGKAGYEYLLAYKVTVPLYDYTVAFCKRYYTKLSSKRTQDQMVQAARSGMQNLLEGNQQASLEGYIKLLGVNSASLEELLRDFYSYARQNEIPVWEKEKTKREVRELGEIWDVIQRNPTLPLTPQFPYLPSDETQTLNLLVALTNQAIYLQKKLRESLEKKFVKEGGFREKLFKKRMEYKNRGSWGSKGDGGNTK